MGEPAKKRTRKEWSEDDTLKLINFWKEKIDDLRKAKRNSSMYEAISTCLQEMGVLKSAVEVKLKIKNLTTKFRNEKKLVGCSGGSPSEWKYYLIISEIIGNLPCNDDNLVEETILIEISDSNNEIEEGMDDTGASSSSSNTNPASPSPASVRKRTRKIAAIQEELLTQISRGNDCMESYCRQAEKYQWEHLKIMMESLKMQNMWFNFLTNQNSVNSQNTNTNNNNNNSINSNLNNNHNDKN